MHPLSNALSKKHAHYFWDIWVLLWVIWGCDGFGWCNDIIVSSSCGPELLRQDPGAHIKTWWPIMTSGLWTSNTQILGHFPLPLPFHIVTGVMCYAHISVGEHKLFTVSPTSNTEWQKKREGLLSVSLHCSWRSLGCITCFDREILLQEIFMIFYLDHHWRVTSSMSLMSEVKVVPIMHCSFLGWLRQISHGVNDVLYYLDNINPWFENLITAHAVFPIWMNKH